MKPSSLWGQGQLFAYSGLDGKTDFAHGLCGYLCGDRIGIRFTLPFSVSLFLSDVRFKSVTYTAVTSDYIAFCADEEGLCFAFLNAYTVIGRIGTKCRIRCLADAAEKEELSVLLTQGERFAFAIGQSKAEAEQRAAEALTTDLSLVEQDKLNYYDRFVCHSTHAALYAKCLSVMKSQVYSPEGCFPHRWSTPDRYPHRNLWLWDSCFHAIGFRHMDATLAEELLLSVFSVQEEDGFIPHMSTPYGHSQITQPPVIAYGALKVYEKSGNKAFLETVFSRNEAFLAWCDKNRRKSELHLYTWHRSGNVNCRCDESGMDNSTRFDTQSELYAIDFSCFMANEMRSMAKIAQILGNTAAAAEYDARYTAIKNDINRVLWNEEDGMYYDFDIDQHRCHTISSVASFLPLLAGICDEQRADRLVATLLDAKKYNTPFPIPSLPVESDYFGDDMWRGPVWVNYNYLVIDGLHSYGYKALSDAITEKTIHYIEKYYLQTGTLYEFYDSEDKVPPYLLNRKGAVHIPYDPGIKMQSIRDYGWTVTLTFDLLHSGV